MNATSTYSGDQIALRDIEPTLRSMWHASADDDHPVTHVRTLNLVVFVPADRHSAALQRTIDELAVRHPGRTITLIASHEQQPAFAEVSLACRLGNGEKHICGEQITLHSGEGGAPLPSTTAALLLPSLPVFLWWVGDPPFADPIFNTLAEVADRVLIDTRTWRSPSASLSALADTMQRTPRFACTDLLWTALTPWRQSIAQCFDGPSNQEHLAQLEQIAVTHGSAEHDTVAAHLLVGWLGSRLGWTADPATGTLRRADGAPVHVALHGHTGAGITAVDLRSADARFTVTRRSHSTCADVAVALPGTAPMQWVVSLKEQPLTAQVGEELMLLDHDAGYEAALQFAVRCGIQ